MRDFRARSSSELLDAAFEIYRRHFWTFLSVGVVATMPSGMARYIISQSLPFTPTASTSVGGGPTSLPLVLLLVWATAAVLTPFAEAAFTIAAARAYRGLPVDLADLAHTAFARPLALFVLFWIRFILLGLGMLLFIVPGLIVFKRYFAVIAAFTLEQRSIGGSIRRSRELSTDNGSRILLLLGAVVLFTLVASWILGAFLQSLARGAGGAVLYLVAAALLSPFASIVMTLLYYDIRIRREGYDIELLASSLETAVPVPAPAF